MGIGPRIKSERERLDLSQTALADLIGSTKRSVINWEGGAASPPADAVARMADAGADVLYILTGTRSQAVAELDLLPADERMLVDTYRRCNADAKRNLIQTAALLSAGIAATPKSKASSGQSVVGDGNIQIGSVGAKARVRTR